VDQAGHKLSSKEENKKDRGLGTASTQRSLLGPRTVVHGLEHAGFGLGPAWDCVLVMIMTMTMMEHSTFWEVSSVT